MSRIQKVKSVLSVRSVVRIPPGNIKIVEIVVQKCGAKGAQCFHLRASVTSVVESAFRVLYALCSCGFVALHRLFPASGAG
jgi:hypothetical protein